MGAKGTTDYCDTDTPGITLVASEFTIVSCICVPYAVS